MIRHNFIFRDWETGSRHKAVEGTLTPQPVQLAAVAIDIKRLEIIPDSIFESLLQPEFDDKKAIELGIAPIEEEALAVNKKTREELADAPKPKFVWDNYVDYLSNYNLKGKSGGKWDAPGVCGFNNTGFDDHIDRYMLRTYGPKLGEYGDWSIYHPFQNIDLHHYVNGMFNNMRISPTNRTSMDACREYFGYKTDGAHDAKIDVLQGADMLIRFLKLFRSLVNGKLDLPMGKKIKFKNCVGGKI